MPNPVDALSVWLLAALPGWQLCQAPGVQPIIGANGKPVGTHRAIFCAQKPPFRQHFTFVVNLQPRMLKAFRDGVLPPPSFIQRSKRLWREAERRLIEALAQ